MDQPLGPARGRRRSCRLCGNPGHYRKDCPQEKERLTASKRPPPPLVELRAGLRLRVVENFHDATTGARFREDEVWQLDVDQGGGLWRLFRVESPGSLLSLVRDGYPGYHPFQPLPPDNATANVPRVGMGPYAEQATGRPAAA